MHVIVTQQPCYSFSNEPAVYTFKNEGYEKGYITTGNLYSTQPILQLSEERK